MASPSSWERRRRLLIELPASCSAPLRLSILAWQGCFVLLLAATAETSAATESWAWLTVIAIFGLLLEGAARLRDARLDNALDFAGIWQPSLIATKEYLIRIGRAPFSRPLAVALLLARLAHFICCLAALGSGSGASTLTFFVLLLLLASAYAFWVETGRIVAIWNDAEDYYMNAAANLLTTEPAFQRNYEHGPGVFSLGNFSIEQHLEQHKRDMQKPTAPDNGEGQLFDMS